MSRCLDDGCNGCDECVDYDDLAVEHEERVAERYCAALFAHPDCRDPAHPGCARCEQEGGAR